jgi:hypothetical protein
MMRNRVTPEIQLIKLILTRFVLRVQRLDSVPEPEVEPIEIRAEIAWIRVALFQFQVAKQGIATRAPHDKRIDPLDKKVDAFRVKVAAKPLKLGGKEHRISMVDLLGRVSAARTTSSDAPMRVLDLIESTEPDRSPLSQ